MLIPRLPYIFDREEICPHISTENKELFPRINTVRRIKKWKLLK